MAYGIRAYWEAKNLLGDTDRIEILEDNFTGSAIEMCADENGFSFNHSIITSDGSDAILNIHGNPVQSGKLDFKLYIQKASEDTLINNISSSLLGDFIIKWYKNGSLEWAGNIVPDVFEKPEKSLGYFTSLRAVDFDILKSETFDLEEGVRTPISILQKIFRTLP